MMGDARMVDVQALLMEPVSIKTRKEWKAIHAFAFRQGFAIGAVCGFLVGVIGLPVLAMLGAQ